MIGSSSNDPRSQPPESGKLPASTDGESYPFFLIRVHKAEANLSDPNRGEAKFLQLTFWRAAAEQSRSASLIQEAPLAEQILRQR